MFFLCYSIPLMKSFAFRNLLLQEIIEYLQSNALILCRIVFLSVMRFFLLELFECSYYQIVAIVFLS